MICATALAITSSLSDLPRAAAECVRVVFRLGILTEDVAQRIEPQDPSTAAESWAMLVLGLAEAEVLEELEQFNISTVSLFYEIFHHLVPDKERAN
jgi:hypothetical protein